MYRVDDRQNFGREALGACSPLLPGDSKQLREYFGLPRIICDNDLVEGTLYGTHTPLTYALTFGGLAACFLVAKRLLKRKG